MGLIGRKIDQTLKYINPSDTKPPTQNYEEIFPITVLDAVRESMDNENSRTLAEILTDISNELKQKQPIFPSRPANYLMTYAGEAGGVGAVQISQEIPWDSDKQRTDRIPTEKAVGDLIFKLGLVDENGNIIDNDGNHVRWSDVIGRPNVYESTGNNDDGFITQKGITDALNTLRSELELSNTDANALLNKLMVSLQDHINNKDNPHAVSLDSIGAAAASTLDYHMNEAVNPHNITAEMIGLGNVDNTADTDKPISTATQGAIDALYDMIINMNDDVGGLNYITGIEYDQSLGSLKVTYRDKSTIALSIPIDGLVDEVKFDDETKEIVVQELNGNEKRISLKTLFIRYLGSASSHITVTIEGDQNTGNQIIHAEINDESITSRQLADDSVITRTIAEGAVTTSKIKDSSVTTLKLSDNAVTSDKIKKLAVLNKHIADRSITGDKLFTSEANNRILAVLKRTNDPVWTLINSDMIEDKAVVSRIIANDTIESRHLTDGSVTSDKIAENSIDESKIKNSSLSSNSLKNNSIIGDKIERDITLPGNPKIESTLSDTASSNEITSARWVLDRIKEVSVEHENLNDRIVLGNNLFTSQANNRALVVYDHDTDPVWGLINNEMMDENSIGTANIKNNSINADKIKDKSIEARHLANNSVSEFSLIESSVTSEKMYTSDNANMVLAALKENGHPSYSKVTKEMMANNSVGTKQIEDGSINPAKFESSDVSNRVLGVVVKGNNPLWTQVKNGMIADNAVDGRTLFKSKNANRVLGSVHAGDDPEWMKISAGMLDSNSVTNDNIQSGAIQHRHLAEKIIDSSNFMDEAITSSAIAANSVTGDKLFRSKYPNRVLAVIGPYMDPEWTQIKSSMLENKSVTGDKLFQSTLPYRVLAATQAGVPPEYTMISKEFIVDGTIDGVKICRNVALSGNPTIGSHPKENSDNFQIADTAWVRHILNSTITDFNIIYSEWVNERIAESGGSDLSVNVISDDDILAIVNGVFEAVENDQEYTWLGNGSTDTDETDTDESTSSVPTTPDVSNAGSSSTDSSVVSGSGLSSYFTTLIPAQTITSEMIQDHSIDGTKLMTSKYTGPRVLGVTKKGEDVEFILIEEDLISNGAVTTNKLQRSIHLLGNPVVEIRPQANASDNIGGGDLIPDCQWVLDRINEAALGGTLNSGNSGSNNSSSSTGNSSSDEEYNEHASFSDDQIAEAVEDASNESIDTIEGSNSSSDDEDCDHPILTTEQIVEFVNMADENPSYVDPDENNSSSSNIGNNNSSSSSSNNNYAVIAPGSITNELLMDRSVDEKKLFSSINDNKVLAVLKANEDPEYTTINAEMLDDHIIDCSKMASTDSDNKILAVLKAGEEPTWATINHKMLEDDIIETSNIKDNSITTDKIVNKSITREKIADDVLIDTSLLLDKSVTNRKIDTEAVTTDKIADKNVTSEKLNDDIVLNGHPTIAPETDDNYEVRSIRNVIISPDSPCTSKVNAQNGDIWFQYM